MRKIMTILAFAAIAAATSVWVVLASNLPSELATLSETTATMVYSAACFGAVGALLVALCDDRCPLQFFCAAATVAALLGLAAFHSTHTRRRGRDSELRPTPVSQGTDPSTIKGSAGVVVRFPSWLAPLATP